MALIGSVAECIEVGSSAVGTMTSASSSRLTSIETAAIFTSSFCSPANVEAGKTGKGVAVRSSGAAESTRLGGCNTLPSTNKGNEAVGVGVDGSRPSSRSLTRAAFNALKLSKLFSTLTKP